MSKTFYRSGLSSSEFCKLHDINIKTFGNNRRKFSDLIEPPTEAPFIEVSKPDGQEYPAPKPHRKSECYHLCI
ncbi:IS66 family insertion sequence element accessory protein TnpA [Vibrio owensii]|uniref:IS66 family insertion sequence element accessory protein TnpA n=1 Tax=Vibrio owensii TaxID=696485 RepID=UPI003DA0AE9D